MDGGSRSPHSDALSGSVGRTCGEPVRSGTGHGAGYGHHCSIGSSRMWFHFESMPHREASTGCVDKKRESVSCPPCLGITERLYRLDRKSTRLNSSHANISYAVFCLKKKKNA